MEFLKFIKELKKYNLTIFTTNDIVKITNQNKNTVNHFIKNQVEKQNIFQLKKGFFSVKQIENKYLYSKIFKNTYISLNSALEFYSITTQRYNNLELISEKELKSTNINDTQINIIKSKHYFGFEKHEIEDNQTIFVANKEKLLIDCLLNLKMVYLSEIMNFIKQTKFNIERLQNYLKQINSASLNKRIGYLLELNKISINLEINNKYELLNTNLKNNELRKNKKWKLIINEDLENE